MLTRCCFRVLQHVFGHFDGGLFNLVDNVLSRFGKRFGNGDTNIKGTLLFDIIRCFNGGFRRFSSFGRLKVKQRFMVSLGHVSPVVMVDGVCGRLYTLGVERSSGRRHRCGGVTSVQTRIVLGWEVSLELLRIDHGISSSIVAAPMAGGPSSNELARAVASTGALGFLGGGNKTAARLAKDYRSVAASGDVE